MIPTLVEYVWLNLIIVFLLVGLGLGFGLAVGHALWVGITTALTRK